jgi:uncharacterized protein YerC
MNTNILEFKPKTDAFSLNDLANQLKSLKEKERLMVNPLLKDWLAIKNEIRSLEKRIHLTQAI